MNLSFDVPSPVAYFAALVQRDADFALLEAAISLAQDDYPEFDVQAVLSEIDQLQARLQRRVPADASAMQKLRLLNQFFFGDLNFAGNVNNYYDPDNSYLHVVLKTRRAIPITLAVLWIELAQSLGLAARGVGFPGHFMVKVNLPGGQVVIDPFDGKSLSAQELTERLEPLRQHDASSSAHQDPLSLFLKTTPARYIIARMLRNLKEIHRAQADWRRVLQVQDRLIVLLPQAWNEWRDRGLAHSELGHRRQAIEDLQTYLAHVSDGQDIAAIADQVAALRA